MEACYFAVVVPASGPAQVLRFHSAEAMAQVASATAQNKLCRDDQIFFFHGSRLRVTSPPFRFLVTASGKRIPLFQSPAQGDFDDSGYVGDVESSDSVYLTCAGQLFDEGETSRSQPNDDGDADQALPDS